MTKNPFLNALAALLYIVAVALVMFFASRFGETPFAFLIPIAVISLFTLSAAVMGYVFLYQPFQLYMEENKTQATNLFLKTVAVFAGITLLLLIAVFLSSVFD